MKKKRVETFRKIYGMVTVVYIIIIIQTARASCKTRWASGSTFRQASGDEIVRAFSPPLKRPTQTDRGE